MRVALFLLAMLVTTGCEAPPVASVPDPLGVTPSDLTIDLTILAGRGAPRGPEVERRPGRYIVFPDGSLHYGSEPDDGPNWRPGLTRRLTREQMAEIWTETRRAGLADAESAETAGNFNFVSPSREGTVYLAAFAAGDRRWTFVREFGPDAAPDPALRGLIRVLARLAWATEHPADHVEMAPVRYDFGPDPYARYRRP